MQQERDSLVLISKDEKFIGRCKQASEFLMLAFAHYPSVSEYLKDDKNRPRTVVLDSDSASAEGKKESPLAAESETEQQLARLKQALPRATILQIASQPSASSARSKANWIIPKDAFTSTFLPEFFFFQKGLCEFYEINPTDLFPDTMVYFNAYHFLPLNQRYFPLVHENFSLTERKHKRIENLKVLYLERRDTSAYIQYIEKYYDQYKVGLRKRTRAWSLQLITGWRNYLMSRLFGWDNPSNFATSSGDFSLWMNEILNYWRSAQDPWALIFETAQLPYFQYENSLLEVAIASYFSRFLGDDESEKIMNIKAELGAYRLLAEPLLVKRWISSNRNMASKEDQTDWAEHYASLAQHPRFQNLDSGILKDVQSYNAEFIARGKSELQNKSLIHIYWGEVIASVFQKTRPNEFKKQDFAEEVIVRCKADGILNEAWIEELRQFLLNGPTQ